MHTCNFLKTPQKLLLAGSLLLASGSAISADSNSLQQQLDDLKAENKVILERLEATADMIDASSDSQNPGSDSSFGNHGSKGKTTIGGYGELHYTNTDSKKEMNLHRFILFMGHEFTNKIRFWSELEVEHAKVDADGGEVAIEQAYVEFDLNENNALRAGVILVPIGIINETHEPPTFYGVERNNVEKYIIPTTWREGGVSLTGRFAKAFSYDLAMHSGLQISSNNNYAVRKGRNSVRKAPMQDPAYTARIKWTGIPGVELAAAVQYQRDVTQSTDASAGSATLLQSHAVWQTGAFAVRALYASWDLSGNGPKSNGSDEQSGWYVEPAYKLTEKWGLYARQSSWDNQVNSANDTERNQTDFGVSYWPHEDVVVKANYQLLDKAGTNDDGFLLGVGYQF